MKHKTLSTYTFACILLFLNLIKQLLPPRDPQSSRAGELTATVEILYCGKNLNNEISTLFTQNYQEMFLDFTFKTNK